MDDAEKIYFVTWHARCLINRHVTVESCIYTTKVLSHLLTDLLGLHTVPVPVGVLALNAKAHQLNREGREPDEDDDALAVACTFRGELHDSRGASWWGAHLILAAWNDSGGEWLIDGSCDQFNQPDADLILEPGIMPVKTGMRLWDWLNDNEPATYEIPRGGSVTYDPHMEDTTYKPTMDWDETQPGDKGYEYIAERVGALLDLYGDQSRLNISQLPKLTPGLSRKKAEPKVIEKFERRAYAELGYTQEEVMKRNLREAVRENRRLAKTMAAVGEEAKATEATLLRAAALLRNPPARP